MAERSAGDSNADDLGFGRIRVCLTSSMFACESLT